MIRIRPSGEVETLSFSIRHQNSGREHLGGSGGSRVQIGGSRVQIGGSRVQIGGSLVQMAAHIWVQMAAAGCNSYPHMWSGLPSMVYPDVLSGYIPCMYSKELSSISYCFGDQKAIKTLKLNTFFIRNDCKGP